MPRHDGGFTGPLSVIATIGIALGVLVMVMSVSILRGFQKDITDKVSGFGSHITVQSYEVNPDYAGETPIAMDSALLDQLKGVDGVKHVQCFATKGGMVKTEDQIYGIMLRGLDENCDTTFFASCLTEGTLPKDDNEVIISSTIASKLRLDVGSKMRTYFWGDNTYRSRAFKISGIYNTDLTEMDELYVIGTLHQVQRLNNWITPDSPQTSFVGGYEILMDDFGQLENTAARVRDILPYYLTMQTVVEANPALFSWLDLLNSNIGLILGIMCLVSVVAIVSALLIMIFEKGSTIGLLKALGATSRSVRRIFMYKGARLILVGIAIGDVLALALSMIQVKWKLLVLDPESYSMTHVPVLIDGWIYLAISVGVMAVCLLALLMPASYITNISPAKTLVPNQ